GAFPPVPGLYAVEKPRRRPRVQQVPDRVLSVRDVIREFPRLRRQFPRLRRDLRKTLRQLINGGRHIVALRDLLSAQHTRRSGEFTGDALDRSRKRVPCGRRGLQTRRITVRPYIGY